MTRKVVSVSPEDSLQFVLELFSRYKFDGLPVVDASGTLVGIITQYDLVTKSSGLHLPTLKQVFESLPVVKRDLGPLNRAFEEIKKLTAKDVMNPEPLVVGPDELAEVAARLFVAHHRVNPIPVVSKGGAVVGILSRYDVIRLFDPNHFASALGEALGDLTERAERGFETEALSALRVIRRDFVLASKWRAILGYVLLGVLLVLGIIAAISILLN